MTRSFYPMIKEVRELKNKKLFVFVVVLVMLALPVAAFAQSTTTLDITTTNITSSLFQGANIMIGALLSIIMLITGFTFGVRILEKISKAVAGGL